MKFNLLLILFNALMIQSCQESKNTGEVLLNEQSKNSTVIDVIENVRLIQSVQEYRYKVNNKDINSFGFNLIEQDQSIGIRSILLVENFIFLVDAVHGNIKKINIKNGEISVSKQLDENNNLRTITLFNNLIYVISDDIKIHLLNLDLKEVSTLEIPSYRWVKDVFKQTPTELFLYRPIEDIHQSVNKEMKIDLIKLDLKNTINRDSIIWEYKEFSKTPYAISNHIRGRQYENINESGNYFLAIENDKFELKGELPNTYKYYDSKNFDFRENCIVYFSISPKEVKIGIYNY